MQKNSMVSPSIDGLSDQLASKYSAQVYKPMSITVCTHTPVNA